jgi:hypothetical protein
VLRLIVVERGDSGIRHAQQLRARKGHKNRRVGR